MKQALYTITTGRSGTLYLTELLRRNLTGALVFHERTGFPHFGVNTPDASHLTTFNNVGNVTMVREFWRSKLGRDANEDDNWLVDVSHILAKGGLIENLDLIQAHRAVTLVLLRRDPFRVAWSFINRFDFFNSGFTWLFTLDPAYRRRIIEPSAFIKHGVFGRSIWYVNEVYARQVYYHMLLLDAGHDNVKIVQASLSDIASRAGAAKFISEVKGVPYKLEEVDLPSPQNTSTNNYFDESVEANIRNLFGELWIDPDVAGKQYFQAGQRL